MSGASFRRGTFLRIIAQRAVLVLSGAAALLLPFGLPAFSQDVQGTIRGAILDQTGGAVAGATVTVIDVARGTTRTLTTDDAGQYLANNLTPGTYTVRAEAKGFQTVEHSDVLVEVGQNIRVDLVVQPGEQTQTITVSGEVPAVDTTDATLGGDVSNNSINSLPLNGRNFARLLELRPGVVYVTQGAGTGGTSSTNGRRAGGDLLLLEGIPEMDHAIAGSTLNAVYKGGDSASLLPIDAIQEFSTEQNPKAEYGWMDGSVVIVGVKSGTNNIHGTAYAFGRDSSATDASNYFTGSVTPATLEQYGGSIGGPILKNKVFWFASAEFIQDNLGSVTVDTIPSDISGLGPSLSMVDACKALTPAKINPLSAQLAGLNPTTCVVSPSSPTFENLFPYNPTTSLNFAPGVASSEPLNNGLFKADWNVSPHHHLDGMYYVSKSTQFESSGILPQWGINVINDTQTYDGHWTWAPNSRVVNDARLGYAYIDDQTLYADANLPAANPWPSGYGMNTGVTNPMYGGLPEITLSSFSAFLGAGSRSGHRGPDGTVDLKDSVSYLLGKHAFKFGFEYADVVKDEDEYADAQGVVKFTTLENFLQGTTNTGTILTGNPATNMRQHWYAGFAQDDWRISPRVTVNLGLRYEYFAPPTERNNYYGNFNPNVNPINTPAVEQVGPGAPISSIYNPQYNLVSPRFGMAWDVRGNGRTIVRAGAGLMTSEVILEELALPSGEPFGANFPSLNINNSGTAINAHTGELLSLSASELNWSLAGPIFPISAAQVINGVTYTGPTCTIATPCATGAVAPNFRTPRSAQWNLDVQRVITSSLTVDVAYVGNHGFDEQYETDLNNPPLGAGWNASAVSACLASAATNYNTCKPNTAAEVGPYSSEFPYLNNIIESTTGAWSNYDALQVTLNQRVSHGLTFLSGYTYSHALDIQSSISGGQLLPTNPNDIGLNYGNSNNDLRHRFTFSPTYAIPGMKSPGQMLEGWSVTGILLMQSGLHWFPDDTVTDDFLGTGENRESYDTTQPGLIQPWNYTGPTSAFTASQNRIPCYGSLGGCTAFASAPASIQAACQSAAQAPYAGNAQLQQLALAALANSACYTQNGGILTPPAYGTIGNEARNLFTGQPYYNVDFAIQKIWQWKERYSAQFRLETFNLFNRANFAAPASTDPSKGSSGGFGYAENTPDSTNPVLGSGGPRHIQFGLKLTF